MEKRIGKRGESKSRIGSLGEKKEEEEEGLCASEKKELLYTHYGINYCYLPHSFSRKISSFSVCMDFFT
jgi:tRNA(His) 5'-end guanylyltransferase